jgi:hypothetical protein
MGKLNLEMIVWECGLEFYSDRAHTFKLSFPFSILNSYIFYPSTLTTLILSLVHVWVMFRIFNFWKFARKIAIYFFQRLMFVQIQVFLYHRMEQ